LARYVRKLHSDRYIKKTLAANPGESFLELIGPSDVAYVICLLKNSIGVWNHDPATTEAGPPKPLYTRGENMKREFGRTAWSDEGMDYYNETLKVWKKMFDRRNAFYNILSGGWDAWLQDAASNLNPNGWTRKDLGRLLATRDVGNMDEREDGCGTDGEIEYDSEDEGAPMIGLGQRRGGGNPDGQLSDTETAVQLGGMDPDDKATEQAVGVAAARSSRRIIEEDDDSDDEEEVGELRARGTKTTGEDDEGEEEEEEDTNPNNGRGTRLTADVCGEYHLPEDDIEDDDEGDDDDKGEREQGKMNKWVADQKKKKKGKKINKSASALEPSAKKQRVSKRAVVTRK